jgi:hypothetical protein
MIRQVHDHLAKEYLEELLIDFGTVKKSQKLISEVLEVDVLFEPYLPIDVSTNSLGILGKMVSSIALFEPYRNAITEEDIRSCVSKLLIAHSDYLKRGNVNLFKPPHLWMLTPTCSAKILSAAGARELESESWGKGIYFLPPLWRSAVIVIHQLPKREETLWLRVLGRGKVQKQAVEELVELPETNPYKENLLAILANWRKNLELRDNVSKSEQEDMMNLSPAYLQQREEWKLEGKLEEATSLILKMVRKRFGEISEDVSQNICNLSLEQLEELGEALLDFQSFSELDSGLKSNQDNYN